MGRPKKDISGAEILKHVRNGAKVTEIAEAFDCDPKTLYNRFSAELARGRGLKKLDLRAWQMKSAKQGNWGALLHLGRVYLGQTDGILDREILETIESQGLTTQDLLELIQNRDAVAAAQPKRSFHEFCIKASYPPPFDKQVEMRAFGIDQVEPRLLLGARGYGKTDYLTVLGTAYDLYLHPMESTTLILTKSRERNAAMLAEIEKACEANGMVFEVANSTSLRVKGLMGKDHSVSAAPIKTKTLRGRHPKRVIMDDPVTEDDVAEATRNHVERIFNEVMKLTSNVLVIGQPAHQYDLYASLRDRVKKLEVPFGSIPELDHDLEAQRLAGVSEASISASYFLKILSEGVNPFNNIRYLEPKFWPAGSAVAFIDPSEGGDFTAMTILRQYLDGVAIFGVARKKAWNHCLDEFEPLLRKYGVKKVAFETNKHGDQPVEMLQQRWPGLGVVGRLANNNKHARIMAAGAFSHLIHMSRESDKLYQDHVVKYEYKAKYDDAPDSLASGLEWIGLIRGKR